MNKLGVSGIITVVLLIVVGIASVVILSVSLGDFLDQDFSAEELKVSLDIPRVSSGEDGYKVFVKRLPGGAEIAGYEVVFTNADKESEVISFEGGLNPLEQRVHIIQVDLDNPVYVEAYPYFLNDEGEKKVSRFGALRATISGSQNNGGSSDDGDSPLVSSFSCSPSESSCDDCFEIFNGDFSSESWSLGDDFGSSICLDSEDNGIVYSYDSCSTLVSDFGSLPRTGSCVYYSFEGYNYYCPSYSFLGDSVDYTNCICSPVSGGCQTLNSEQRYNEIFNFDHEYFTG